MSAPRASTPCARRTSFLPGLHLSCSRLFLSRRASDSYGVRAFTVDGTKAYLLCDYSSVTSYYAVAPNGRLLFDYA